MSHNNLTHWIEDADARDFCRDATFLAGVEQKQRLHLGTMIATIAEWWHHTVADELLDALHHEPRTRH
jgi:hypothetical protein